MRTVGRREVGSGSISIRWMQRGVGSPVEPEPFALMGLDQDLKTNWRDGRFWYVLFLLIFSHRLSSMFPSLAIKVLSDTSFVHSEHKNTHQGRFRIK